MHGIVRAPPDLRLGEPALDEAMKAIVVCEMWAQEFEHVDFNSAFLRTASLAFPAAKLTFLSARKHADLVRSRLRQTDIPSLVYDEVPVPTLSMPGVRQLLVELRACWRAFVLARRCSAGAVIFTCLKGSSLRVIKTLMRVLAPNLPSFAIVHGELSTVTAPPQRRPWNNAISLRSALESPTPERLRYIVLGDSIRDAIARLMPRSAPAWRSIELVGIPPADSVTEGCGFEPGQPIRFGFLGAASKGFAAFCQIAQAIKSEYPNVEFEMIGFLGNTRAPEDAERYVSGISAVPLSVDEYRRRLNGVSYCLSIDNPEHHRLAGSGTFVDTFWYAKPYISLRNPYLQYYFRVMGDIGYLCDSLDELRACLRRIIAEPPRLRYATQQANIIKGRGIFAPEQAALKLRRILSEQAG